jgi:hypothetical protein
MQKWGYLVIDVTITTQSNRAEVRLELNRLGEEGWELVGVSAEQSGDYPKLFFKRACR